MQNPMFDKDEITELTEEEYIEGLEELGLEPMTLTMDATRKIAESFEEMALAMNDGAPFNELREMHQRLEPKHARSPKRHLLHKKAVENRKKRKRGGKK